MENAINFRTRLNDCNSKLQEIALLEGQTKQTSEVQRKNNTFFNAFEKYIELVKAYGVIKQFDDFNINMSDIAEIKSITNQIKRIFEKKQSNNELKLQISIKKTISNLQTSWFKYINELISETVEQLEIFCLVCNNKREIREMINSIKGITEWPLNEEKYKKYISNIDAANEKIEEIHFDKEIEDFLKKIKNKTATLLDLNDKILDWIKENQLKGNIMLSIRTIFV